MDAGEMTDATMRKAATCEYPWVACCPMSDGTSNEHHERVRKPTISSLEQAGANHFIETRLYDDNRREFFIRVDGYKKP